LAHACWCGWQAACGAAGIGSCAWCSDGGAAAGCATHRSSLAARRFQHRSARRTLSLDITVEEVRAQVARIVGQGDEVTTGQIPFTPRAKKVLELALREALSLGHNYIGTEHILLGLVRENEGVAARILLDFDADAEKIRNEIIRMLSGPGRREQERVPESPPVAPEVIAELARLQQEVLAALEAGRFEAAAGLRDRERALTVAAGALESAWRAAVAAAAETAPLAGELPPYQPASPPAAREVVEEIELARREREQAVEAKAFERAVAARDRERNLIAAARALERAWETPAPTPRQPQPALLPRGGSVTLGEYLAASGRCHHGASPSTVRVGCRRPRSPRSFSAGCYSRSRWAPGS